jgi:hypothetical protein
MNGTFKNKTRVQLSKEFYKTRNDIAHYNQGTAEYKGYSDLEWNTVIQFTLRTISWLYSEFDDYINKLGRW